MVEHHRLGVVERAVLESLDSIGARPDRPHRKSANVVMRMSDQWGVSPRYGYDALCRLAQPWRLQIPLVDFHGNFGSADDYDQPAGPRYTEARLSAAGAVALDAERGAGPRVPHVLINGTLHVDGTAPPFSPRAVTNALLALLDDPALANEELVTRVGPPASPTGCDVACDIGALAAGEPTEMTLAAHLHHEHDDGQQLIVVTNLPYDIGDDTAAQAIAARAGRHPYADPDDLDERLLPLRDVRIESRQTGTRIVCELHLGADPAEVALDIASTWGVTTHRTVQLPAPLARLMRELVDDDQAAQRAAIERLTA